MTNTPEQRKQQHPPLPQLEQHEPNMASQVSSISQALAGNATALKIPKPEAIDHSFAADCDVSAALAAASKTKDHGSGLPTPPNSISPNLQPEAFRAKLAKELASSPPLSQIDSDIDLQDAADDANPQDRVPGATDDANLAEGVGIITPAYLAKHHLANMILERGPIAIRHVMNFLARQVPGFAEIPPAKARRIVVAALESRNGGGLHGEVEFEKVGWGRWDARVKGQPSRSHRAMFPLHERPLSPPGGSASASLPAGPLRIPGNGKPRSKSRRLSYGSWTADSTLSSRSGRGGRVDADVVEHEADAMSIDGEEEQAERPLQRRLPYRSPQPEFYSDTDEEDWSNVDPAALGASSYRSGGGKTGSFSGHRRASGASGPRSFAPHNWSIPPQNQVHSHQEKLARLDFSGVEMDSQEKSAIEALIRMGSM